MKYDTLSKEILKAGGKITYGATENISPIIEWLKWLNYEPEFEKKRIASLNSKNASELSLEELKELTKYNKNKTMAKLFKIYGTSECSEEDSIRVYEYMRNESIIELMLSKLTHDEICYVKEEILKLREVPKEQLRAKIKEEQQPAKYEQLSMADSYILHVISDMDYARDMTDLNKLMNSLRVVRLNR